MSKHRQLASDDRHRLKTFLASMYNTNQLQVMLNTYTDNATAVPDRSPEEVAYRVSVLRELLGAPLPANEVAALATSKPTSKRK